MQTDFHAEVAKETARQVRDLQAVTTAQAMPALCFLLGAYAPRRPASAHRRDIVEDRSSSARGPALRSQLKIVKAWAVTATEPR